MRPAGAARASCTRFRKLSLPGERVPAAGGDTCFKEGNARYRVGSYYWKGTPLVTLGAELGRDAAAELEGAEDDEVGVSLFGEVERALERTVEVLALFDVRGRLLVGPRLGERRGECAEAVRRGRVVGQRRDHHDRWRPDPTVFAPFSLLKKKKSLVRFQWPIWVRSISVLETADLA